MTGPDSQISIVLADDHSVVRSGLRMLLEAEADLEEVSASCGHFSFSLLEFGEQLQEMLGILDELQLEVEERPNGRSWSWLKIWRWTKNAQASKAKLVDEGMYSTTTILA